MAMTGMADADQAIIVTTLGPIVSSCDDMVIGVRSGWTHSIASIASITRQVLCKLTLNYTIHMYRLYTVVL